MKKLSFFLVSILTGLLIFLFLTSSNSVSEPPLNGIYNVRDYGAKGDGRADDTSAFDQAIHAAHANGGGDVYIPLGLYIVNPLFLKSGVNLTGENRDTVTLKLSDSADSQKMTRLINIEDSQDVAIQHLTLDGNYEKHRDGVEHMHTLFVWDSKNIRIDNNRMRHAVGDGISISGSVKASENITISNNILLNNHRSNIVVEQVNDIHIFNNTSTSTIGRPVLHFEPFEDIHLYGAKIYDNVFETNANEAYTIQIEGTMGKGNYYHDIEFYDNTVKGKNGRFMIKETKNAKIYGNDFDIKDLYIWFQNSDLDIYNNTFQTKDGLVIQGHLGSSTGTRIANNDIATLKNAVTIKASSKDTVFSGNTFTGKGHGYGAYLWATNGNITHTTFEKNVFRNFRMGIQTDTYGGYIVDGLEVYENQFETIEQSPLYTTKESSLNVRVGENVYTDTGDVYME